MSDRILAVHAPAPPVAGSDRRRWWALVWLCLAQFMVILDITVVRVALPTIGTDRTWIAHAATANDLGLGAEQVDPRNGELLGNFPGRRIRPGRWARGCRGRPRTDRRAA